jgi:putative SOS response-associated peptidase YedK
MTGSDGKPLLSFAMLTVNATGHPVFGRMHRPDDEKRMVVMLDAEDYDHWLSCSRDEATAFFRPWQGPLDAAPAPLPARQPASARRAAPPPDANQSELL